MNMQKQKPIWSKILAMLCALALCISMVPAASAAPPTSLTSNVSKVTMTANGITEFWTDTGAQIIDSTEQTSGNAKYSLVGNTLTIKPTTDNSYLPKTISFWAMAEYEPTIEPQSGVTISSVDYGSNWWLITLAFTTASGVLNLSISAAPVTYQVSFTGSNFSVTDFTASNEQSSAPYTVNKGDNVTFTLTPNDGFTITQVVANETTILKANENDVYTISNIQENKSIAVTTEQTTYSITFDEKSSEKHYTLIQGASPVAHGGSYTFSVIPEEGYNAPTVMVSEATLTPTNYAYTIGNITENKTITITNGTVQQRTVTFTSGEGYSFVTEDGSAITENTTTVDYNGNVSFKVDLNSNYSDSNVKVYANGIEIESTDGVYTIESITVDQTVSVTGVAINTYQVTLPTDWTGYTISTVDGTSVPAGGTFTFTVTPAAGYTITSVTFNDSAISPTPNNDNTYSIIPEPGKNVIAVVAEPQTYTLSTTPNDSTINTGSLHFGNNTITITPNAGYKVDSVTFDGATVAPGANNNYTIYVTRNDHQLVVTTSPVVNVTLTTTVTATGNTTYTIVVATFPGEVTGDSAGISVVGYGTLYSNKSFSSQSLKDAILGLTLDDTLTQQQVSDDPVVYSYSKETNFSLDDLTNTFSYTFNNSSSKNRFGAGWIKLSDGQNSWIVFSESVHCQ